MKMKRVFPFGLRHAVISVTSQCLMQWLGLVGQMESNLNDKSDVLIQILLSNMDLSESHYPKSKKKIMKILL